MREERARQVAWFQGLIAAGSIRIGMTRQDVKALLGEPCAMGCTSRKYPTPSCFKYGDVQVFFGPRARDGLILVFSEEPDGEDPITLLSAG